MTDVTASTPTGSLQAVTDPPVAQDRTKQDRSIDRVWSDHRSLAIGAIVVVILIGVGLRLWIMTGKLGTIDSDEAITGLMARHLSTASSARSCGGSATRARSSRGRWRRASGSSGRAVSARAAVPAHVGGGDRDDLAHRPPVPRPFQAVFAALVFWLWPAIYVWVGVKPLFFYVPTLVLGLVDVLCASARCRRPTRSPTGACSASPPARVVDVAQHRVLPAPLGVWFLAFHWRSLLPRALYAGPVRGPRRAAVDLEPDLRVRLQAGRTATPRAATSTTSATSSPMPSRPRSGSGRVRGRWVAGPGRRLRRSRSRLLALAIVLGLRASGRSPSGLLGLPVVFAFNPLRRTPPTDWWATVGTSTSSPRSSRSPWPLGATGRTARSRQCPWQRRACGASLASTCARRIGVVRRSTASSRGSSATAHEVFASFWVSSPHVRERRTHRGRRHRPRPHLPGVRGPRPQLELPAYVFFASDKAGIKYCAIAPPPSVRS